MPTEPVPRHHRWAWPLTVILITLFAFALRWQYVSTAVVLGPLRGDAVQYFAHAWNLVHHGVFSGSDRDAAVIIPDSFRDPGYPLLLAAWMKLFDAWRPWYAAVLMCQAALGALTVPLAMQLGRRWLARRWAAAAGVLMAVWPHSIAITSDLLTETLFGFLCALALLLCARACERDSRGWAVAAGIIFGMAALTNAILLPFGVGLALFLAWRHLAPRRVWLALCLGALVLPAGWAVRNHFLPAQAAGQTSTDRALMNLVQGSWPNYHSSYRAWALHGSQQGAQVIQQITSEYQLLRNSPAAGAAQMLHRVSAHPLEYASWYAVHKPLALWDWSIQMGQGDIYVYPVADSPFNQQAPMRALEALCHTLNWPLAALMFGCLIFALVRHWRAQGTSRRGQAAFDASLLLVAFATLVYTAMQAEPRYAIPFRSFEFLLAMTSCSLLAGWVARIRREYGDPRPTATT